MIPGMSVTKEDRRVMPKASPGTAIAARRTLLGLTQDQFSERLEELLERNGHGLKFPRKLIGEIENDRKPIWELRLAQYDAVLEVLRLTPAEFEEMTGVTALVADDDLPGTEPYRPTFKVPFAGDLSTAFPAGELRVKQSEPLSIDLDRLDPIGQLPLENLVAFKVDQDALVSEAVVKTLIPGSDLVVEMRAAPKHGDTVLVWLPNVRLIAVAAHGEAKDTILRSYRAGGPVFRLDSYDFEVRGVVRMTQLYSLR